MSKVRIIFGAFMINDKRKNERIKAGFGIFYDSDSGVFPLKQGRGYV
jgi:hypothetical protein